MTHALTALLSISDSQLSVLAELAPDRGLVRCSRERLTGAARREVIDTLLAAGLLDADAGGDLIASAPAAAITGALQADRALHAGFVTGDAIRELAVLVSSDAAVVHLQDEWGIHTFAPVRAGELADDLLGFWQWPAPSDGSSGANADADLASTLSVDAWIAALEADDLDSAVAAIPGFELLAVSAFTDAPLRRLDITEVAPNGETAARGYTWYEAESGRVWCVRSEYGAADVRVLESSWDAARAELAEVIR